MDNVSVWFGFVKVEKAINFVKTLGTIHMKQSLFQRLIGSPKIRNVYS